MNISDQFPTHTVTELYDLMDDTIEVLSRQTTIGAKLYYIRLLNKIIVSMEIKATQSLLKGR